MLLEKQSNFPGGLVWVIPDNKKWNTLFHLGSPSTAEVISDSRLSVDFLALWWTQKLGHQQSYPGSHTYQWHNLGLFLSSIFSAQFYPVTVICRSKHPLRDPWQSMSLAWFVSLLLSGLDCANRTAEHIGLYFIVIEKRCHCQRNGRDCF